MHFISSPSTLAQPTELLICISEVNNRASHATRGKIVPVFNRALLQETGWGTAGTSQQMVVSGRLHASAALIPRNLLSVPTGSETPRPAKFRQVFKSNRQPWLSYHQSHLVFGTSRVQASKQLSPKCGLEDNIKINYTNIMLDIVHFVRHNNRCHKAFGD